jgi:hypothetical protein
MRVAGTPQKQRQPLGNNRVYGTVYYFCDGRIL